MVSADVTQRPASNTSKADPLAWLVGIIVGAVVSVRCFGSGLLLNWDQVIGPTIPVPPGFRGLGPELPRRVPFYGPLAAASEVIGGPNTIAILIWLTMLVACLGVVRLVDCGRRGIALGVVYALSPFLLSRLAIGHLPLAFAAAVLPHALIDLGNRQRRWLWAIVFGFTGSSGAVLGLVPLTIATMRRERSWKCAQSLLVLAASQAMWIVPGLVVLAGDGALPASASALFRARIDGVFGPTRAIAGGGLFLVDEDVAGRSPVASAILGLVLLVGVAGLTRSWRATNRRGPDAKAHSGVRTDMMLSAVAGLVLFVGPTVSVLAQPWDDALVGPLALFRESHKFWPLFGLLLLCGLGDLFRQSAGDPTGRRATGVAALALALLAVVVGWTGLWGAGGRLVAVGETPGLAAIRSDLADGDHVVLALPWQRYGPSSLAGGRTVLEPSPWLLSGEVIASGRAFATVDSNERSTPDDEAFTGIDRDVRAGLPVADRLRALGVDRVVVLGSTEAAFYRRLGAEPGVDLLMEEIADDGTSALMLFAITAQP